MVAAGFGCRVDVSLASFGGKACHQPRHGCSRHVELVVQGYAAAVALLAFVAFQATVKPFVFAKNKDGTATSITSPRQPASSTSSGGSGSKGSGGKGGNRRR